MNLEKTINEEYQAVSENTVQEIKITGSKNIEHMFKIAKEHFLYEADWLNRIRKQFGNAQKDYRQIYDAISAIWKYAPFPAQEKTHGSKREEHTPLDEKLYTPEEITFFCILAEEMQSDANFHTLGFLLSALVNYHQERTNYEGEYTIPTKHLERKICDIGYENSSNMKVIGNAGANAFLFMKKGNVYIEGDAQENFAFGFFGGNLVLNGTVQGRLGGSQTGGTIVIEKDVLGDAGRRMKGGTLIIKGGVKEDVADFMRGGVVKIYGPIDGKIASFMEGGSIYLYDENRSISTNFENGKIYQNDKIILPKWRKIFPFLKRLFP